MNGMRLDFQELTAGGECVENENTMCSMAKGTSAWRREGGCEGGSEAR